MHCMHYSWHCLISVFIAHYFPPTLVRIMLMWYVLEEYLHQKELIFFIFWMCLICFQHDFDGLSALAKTDRNRHLLLWYYESQLKNKFEDFVDLQQVKGDSFLCSDCSSHVSSKYLEGQRVIERVKVKWHTKQII